MIRSSAPACCWRLQQSIQRTECSAASGHRGHEFVYDVARGDRRDLRVVVGGRNLYDICANKRKDAKEATAYNALIADWTELTRQAAAVHDTRRDGQMRFDV